MSVPSHIEKLDTSGKNFLTPMHRAGGRWLVSPSADGSTESPVAMQAYIVLM